MKSLRKIIALILIVCMAVIQVGIVNAGNALQDKQSVSDNGYNASSVLLGVNDRTTLHNDLKSRLNFNYSHVIDGQGSVMEEFRTKANFSSMNPSNTTLDSRWDTLISGLVTAQVKSKFNNDQAIANKAVANIVFSFLDMMYCGKDGIDSAVLRYENNGLMNLDTLLGIPVTSNMYQKLMDAVTNEFSSEVQNAQFLSQARDLFFTADPVLYSDKLIAYMNKALFKVLSTTTDTDLLTFKNNMPAGWLPTSETGTGTIINAFANLAKIIDSSCISIATGFNLICLNYQGTPNLPSIKFQASSKNGTINAFNRETLYLKKGDTVDFLVKAVAQGKTPKDITSVSEYYSEDSSKVGVTKYVDGNAIAYMSLQAKENTAGSVKVWGYRDATNGTNNDQNPDKAIMEFNIVVSDSGMPVTAPTDITLSNSIIEENRPILSTIGELNAAGVDNNSISYTIMQYGDYAKFTLTGNLLKANDVFNYEQKNSYQVKVKAYQTANPALSYEKILTITVNNVNDAPANLALTPVSQYFKDGKIMVPENFANINIATLSASDEDAGQVLTYSIVDGDVGYFKLEGSALKIGSTPLDFEKKNKYSIRLRVSDNGNPGLALEKTFDIYATDYADNPTDILISNNKIKENMPIGSFVGNLSTTDEDVAHIFTYTLLSETANFEIVGNQLKTKAVFNYEAINNYTVSVNVTDNASAIYGTPTNGTFTKDINIQIENVNEAPSAISLSNSSVNENAVVGTTVGNIIATDPESDACTFSLVANGDSSKFTIVNNVLKTNEVFNYEVKNTYTIKVKADDTKGGTFEQVFDISINNVNEAPTDISLSNNTITELLPANTVIGVLSDVDPDTNDTATYSVVVGADKFTINGNKLVNNAAFNYDTAQSHTVKIKVTDGGGLSYEKTFTINIIDSITNAVVVLSNSSIAENNAIVADIGTLSVIGFSGNVTYSIVSGDTASFSINGATLKTTQSFNYETKNKYTIKVRATSGTNTVDQDIIINVTDVAEAPTDLTISNSSINENRPSGSIVGTLTAVDEDKDSSYTYAITTQEVAGKFVVEGNQLKTAAIFDYEQKPSYKVTVKATDTVNASFNYTKEFTININDLPEAPTAINISSNTIDENKVIGTVVGNITVIDQDINDVSTITIVPDFGDATAFTVDGNSLKSAAIFDFETKNSYSIKLKATDKTGLSIEKIFNIGINNVNDAPTDIFLLNNTITEFSPVSTKISDLVAIDPENSQMSFELVSNYRNNDKFEIRQEGGKWCLYSKAQFDYMVQNYLSIKLKAKDVGNLSIEKAFTVYVNLKRVTIDGVVTANNEYAVNKKVILQRKALGTNTFTDYFVTYTGTSGEYSFIAKETGIYRIKAEGNDFYSEAYCLDGSNTKEINVDDATLKGASVYTGCDIKMLQKYVIGGRLSVTVNKGALPAVDAVVTVSSSTTNGFYTGRTDSQGKCTINDILVIKGGTQSVNYTVSVSTEEDSDNRVVGIAESLDGKPTTTAFTFSNYDTISGNVKKDGSNLAGRYVNAINESNGRKYVAFTDASGNYTIAVKSGSTYTLKPDLLADELCLELKNIPSVATNKNFDIRKGIAIIGNVKDDTNKPLVNINVSVLLPDAMVLTGMKPSINVFTDSSGNFAFPSEFKAGTYTLKTGATDIYPEKNMSVVITDAEYISMQPKNVSIVLQGQAPPNPNPFPAGTNRITVNGSQNQSIQVGDEAWFNVSYLNEGLAGISDLKFNAEIPAGVTITSGSNVLTISRLAQQQSGSYRFKLAIPGNYSVSNFDVNLYAEYQSAGKNIKLFVSKAHVNVYPRQYVTIVVPSAARKGEYITVSGETNEGSTVTIYRNNQVAAVAVTKGKYYSANILMPNEGVFKFKAISNKDNFSAVSDEVTCSINNTAVSVDRLVNERLVLNYQYFHFGPIKTLDRSRTYSTNYLGYAVSSLIYWGYYPRKVQYTVSTKVLGLLPDEKVSFIKRSDIGNKELSATLGADNLYSVTFDVEPLAETLWDTLYFYVKVTKADNTVILNKLILRTYIIMDPSGYVYDENTKARIEGAEVLLKKQNQNGTFDVWDPVDGQKNPLITDADGFYNWNVEPGTYALFVKKQGYNYDEYLMVDKYTTEGGTIDSIIIPPPRTDVHVALKNTQVAKIVSTIPEANKDIATDGYFEIKYDKPFVAASANTQNCVVKDSSGTVISATVTVADNDTTIRILPNANLSAGTTYTVTIQNIQDKVNAKDGTLIKMPPYEYSVNSAGVRIITYPSVSEGNANTVDADQSFKLKFSKAVLAGTVSKENFILTNDKGDAIQYTVKVDPLDPTVVIVTPDILVDGAKYTVTVTTNVKDIDNIPLRTEKTLTFTTTGTATPTPTPTPKPSSNRSGYKQHISTFVDITGHWSESYVTTLAEKGIISGYKQDDGTFTFEPDKKITREEFAKIMVLTLGLTPEIVQLPFEDVGSISPWALPYVGAAYKAGIFVGSKENDKLYFLPSNLISRVEVGVVVGRAFKTTASTELAFADNSAIPQWAVDMIKVSTEKGVINGYTDQTFKPFDNATRGEAAKMIVVFLQKTQ